MAIAKLNLLEIDFPLERVDDVLSRLVGRNDFHPELASTFTGVHGLSVLKRDNPYRELAARIESLTQYGLTIEQKKPQKNVDVKKADEMINQMLDQLTEMNQITADLEKLISENEDAIVQLTHMQDYEENLDDLFTSRYLQIRFGRMPSSNLDKLDYYANQIFLFKSFYRDVKDCYCMYITTKSKAPEIDNIFSSLYFTRIYIPKFCHGTPASALTELQNQVETAKHSIEDVALRREALLANYSKELSQVYATCKQLTTRFDADQYVVDFGEYAAVIGFVEESRVPFYQERFEKIEGVKVVVKPPMGDSRLYPPSKLKNSWFAKPFSMFVEMYGVPAYTDYDPTLFVAISYSLLFGIMFGDVGQGLLLAVIGYLVGRRFHMQLGKVGVRIGLFSILFGVVFGSVFGNEEILTPFFLPMESSNTMTLLGTAIAIGVLLTLTAMLVNIYINARRKRLGEILFSQNGISGMVFYMAVLLLVVNMIFSLHLPLGLPYILGLIVLPAFLMFLKEPLSNLLEGNQMFPHGFGGFFAEAFFELFDVVLSFVSNTMSFLRVGGFVLSHAGMMMVVYTLAKMTGEYTPGYYAILVIGNIFVMVLEGLSVGIQVLRLEFYEMFSRYYSGNGRKFVSMKKRLSN